MIGTTSAAPGQHGHLATEALTVHGVSKRFGSTQAVDDVSFDVRRGEVHALLGHNGSGKSTLVKMISGLLPPDSGRFSTGTHADSRRARIGIVHQDLALCGDATVLENCCMGGYIRTYSGLLDWNAERRALQPVLDSLDVQFVPGTMVRDLSPANQAIVAIARALKGSPGGEQLKLLILDEATARLRGKDADLVLKTARRVASQGAGVLLVTHHMTEVLAAADRATVLSNGAVVETVDVASTDETALLRIVSGRDLNVVRSSPSTRSPSARPPTLVTSRLMGSVLRDVSIAAYPGQILGITGATGAGFEELPYLIATPGRGRGGTVMIDGAPLRARSIAESRRRGVGLVPEGRLQRGLHLGATVRENLSPLVRATNTSIGLVSTVREGAWAAEVCHEFNIKVSGSDAVVASLSGGNQQKVLLARVLKDRPRLLLLHEPTQGVDEPTRRALIGLVRDAAEAGAAVVYVSCDIEEVAGSSDRVLVFQNGRCMREISGGLEHADEVYASSYLNAQEDGAPSTH